MKILIINPFGIGDVIFSTPLIEALKGRYPDSMIGYVCNRRAYEVIKSNPHLGRIFIYEKDDFRSAWQDSKINCIKKLIDFLKLIKNEKFDIAIDLSLGHQCSFLLKVIGIKRIIGFNYRNRGRFLSQKINIEGFNDKHVIEYYLETSEFLGIESLSGKVIRPKVYLSDDSAAWADDFLKKNGIEKKDVIVGIIPGCGASWGADAAFRRWSWKKFAAVADSIAEKYKAKIILFGDRKEVPICENIRDIMKNNAVMACGKTKLGEFLGIISRCSLVITNDGGPLHMAVGLGVNTVSIFGPVDEKIYGPYPAGNNHVVISKKDLLCRPCYKRFKYTMCSKRTCLETIEPQEVIDAAEKILKR